MQSTANSHGGQSSAAPRLYAAVTAALWLALLAVGPALALDPTRSLTQSFQRIWQVPQGLPQPTIFALRQTGDGYLWLGTPAGLHRFDGVRFTTLRDVCGVPAEKVWVNGLDEDRQDNLWVGTQSTGLIRVGRDDSMRYTRADGLPSNAVQCVFVDRRGAIWAGTDNGLARLTADIAVYRQEAGLGTQDIHAIAEASDGRLWIAGSGNRVTVFDGNTFVARELKSLAPDCLVRALLCDKEGAIWIGSSDGLTRFKDDEETHFTTTDGLADDSIFCLAAAQDGSLWVGTKQGFSRLHDGEWDSFSAADGLSQSTVYALTEDREGSLWVGTKHGLNQFSDRRAIPFTVREGLPSNHAGPICEDAAGTMWVGTLDAGLARFDGRRFSTLTVAEGLASNAILALAQGNDNALWVGTDHGLNRLSDGHVDASFVAQGLPSNVVRALLSGDDGRVWVGTSTGLVTLRDGRLQELEGEPDDLRVSISALFRRRDGVILAAAESGGLYRCDGKRLSRFHNAALRHYKVAAFFEDGDGQLWLGTRESGLVLLDGERAVQLTTKNGLYDDDISALIGDDEDRLWMSSSNGMSYVPRVELVKFAAGALASVTSTPVRFTDSLRTFESQHGVQPAIVKARDGRIWLSTTRGIVVVDPEHLQRVLPPTPVVIEDVVVNGREQSPRRVEKLPPGSSNIAFDYTALSFLAPNRITFRYMLEGFDSDWIDAGGRREAFYTNLPPGSYRFRVAARNVDNAEWEAAQPVRLAILPHFYQTWWFPALCAAALGLGAWAAYRLRVQRIKEQMRAVVAERSRIARELHDTLVQGFSGVTMEMQALATRLSPSEKRGTLEEIIRDAAHCLREARRSIAGLRRAASEQSGLASAIAEAAKQITETRDVRLKLDLQNSPRTLPVDVEYNLLRIAQEAVANAVKHAAARLIEVTLECNPRVVRLTVSDDGVGFAAPTGPVAQWGHYGLIGMKERAAQIGGELTIDSGPAAGTTVTVRVPLAEARDAVPHAAAREDSQATK